jgi:hypothetical protein
MGAICFGWQILVTKGLGQGGNTPHVIEAKLYIIAFGTVWRLIRTIGCIVYAHSYYVGKNLCHRVE